MKMCGKVLFIVKINFVVTKRFSLCNILFNTDMPVAFVQLAENPPWVKRNEPGRVLKIFICLEKSLLNFVCIKSAYYDLPPTIVILKYYVIY